MIQPPTDNLHKFLAVSGLLVAGFSVYVPRQYLQEYNRAALEYHADRARSLEKVIGLDDDARERLVCAIAAAKADESGVPMPERQKQHCDRIEKTEAVPDPLAEWRAGHEVLGVREQWIDVLHQNSRLAAGFGIIFIVLGLVTSVAGFWMWYVRLQKYEDAAARSNSAPARPE